MDPKTWWGSIAVTSGNKPTPLGTIAALLAQFPASIAPVERGNKVSFHINYLFLLFTVFPFIVSVFQEAVLINQMAKQNVNPRSAHWTMQEGLGGDSTGLISAAFNSAPQDYRGTVVIIINIIIISLIPVSIPKGIVGGIPVC